MADLHFVDFALIPNPVRKEKQFRLPDHFTEFDFTVVSWTSHSTFGFPALFQVFTQQLFTSLLFSDPQNVLLDKGEISTFPLSEVEIVAC